MYKFDNAMFNSLRELNDFCCKHGIGRIKITFPDGSQKYFIPGKDAI